MNVGPDNFNDEARPFANRHAASLRAIYDFSDLEKSLFIHSGGHSGDVLSPHQAASTDAWARVEYIATVTARATRQSQPHALPRLVPLK